MKALFILLLLVIIFCFGWPFFLTFGIVFLVFFLVLIPIKIISVVLIGGLKILLFIVLLPFKLLGL